MSTIFYVYMRHIFFKQLIQIYIWDFFRNCQSMWCWGELWYRSWNRCRDIQLWSINDSFHDWPQSHPRRDRRGLILNHLWNRIWNVSKSKKLITILKKFIIKYVSLDKHASTFCKFTFLLTKNVILQYLTNIL